MFKKLRNRFLILNLVIISVTMLLAFASIYFITYNNVRSDILMELGRISDNDRRLNERPNQLQPDFDKFLPPERSVSFVITTDGQLNTKTVYSVLNIDEEFYESAKSSALSKNSNTGDFKLDGNYWTFMIKPYLGGYKIIFLDITPRQGILTSLIYTFFIVGSIMLVFIFFISRFFANRAIKPVEESFDKQKQFIADASHELKTPLAVINTNVDVLLSNSEGTIHEQSKWLYYIKSEVERMSNLTKDLLYLTQLDHSDIKMIYTDFDLSEAVENVILTMEAVIFENNISFDNAIEPGLMIHGNCQQVQQVIMILLDNAIKYTNVKGSICIDLKKHYANAAISLTNTGAGISQEHIGKIFDRFYRADKSRTRESGGYGLGLSIAKTIVEQHGGQISVKSIINASTTFRVELPLISK